MGCVNFDRLHAFPVEIPNEPVTVFEAEHDRIKVELNFNAELSNVLIVNARSVGDEEFGCTVAFNMGGVSRFSI